MSNPTHFHAEPNSSVLRIERTFNAPREKVFRAFTIASKVKQWWSPGGTARVDEFDVRAGGSWRFADTPGDQEEIVFFGYFHEVTSPERIVQTVEFANLPERGHVVLDRYEFRPLGEGQTQMVLTESYLSVEDRDAAMASGMEAGIASSYEILDRVLAVQEEA